MELTKIDTKMIQGLSVLAMVWLHLFDRSYEGLFQPLVFLFGIPLSFYIAQLCDFCVMGFAFCTGYAHYLTSQDSDYIARRKRSLLKLLVKYWIVLVVFCIVSIIAGKQRVMPGSMKRFILSVVGWSNAYNGAWWYLLVYVVLVVLSPWLQKAVRKHSKTLILSFCFIIYVIAYLIRFKMNVRTTLLVKLGLFGMTLFEYILGSLVAKEQYFTKISTYSEKLTQFTKVFISTSVLIVILLIHTLVIPSLFIAPATGMIIITLFRLWNKPRIVQRLFLYTGNHSVHIWLTHMFFVGNPFKKIAYKAVYPLCIFGILIGITLFISVLLNYIEKKVFHLLLI